MILTRLYPSGGKYIAHALPRKTKVGTVPTAGLVNVGKAKRGTAARTVPEVAKKIFNSRNSIMIKKRQVVFEVVEDTETKERSMNGQLNIEDMKIIIEMIYQFVKQHPCLFDEDPYLFDEGGYDV